MPYTKKELICATSLALITMVTPCIVHAQNRQPYMPQEIKTGEILRDRDSYCEVTGRVTGQDQQPISGVYIMAYQADVLKGTAISDAVGVYSLKPLAAGNFDLVVAKMGYDTLRTKNVNTNYDKVAFQNYQLKVTVLKANPDPKKDKKLTIKKSSATIPTSTNTSGKIKSGPQPKAKKE